MSYTEEEIRREYVRLEAEAVQARVLAALKRFQGAQATKAPRGPYLRRVK